MKKFGFPLLIVGIVGLMIAVFALGNSNTSGTPTKTPGAVPLGDKHDDQGQKHIAVGEAHDPYNSNTPSSGPHYASPTPWGVKSSAVADETLVHNAEHGGTIITYKPDLPADQIQKLKDLYTSLPLSTKFNEVKLVVAPREANTAPIQLMAWTYTYSLNAFDQDKIEQFYADHLDKGPELVP